MLTTGGADSLIGLLELTTFSALLSDEGSEEYELAAGETKASCDL